MLSTVVFTFFFFRSLCSCTFVPYTQCLGASLPRSRPSRASWERLASRLFGLKSNHIFYVYVIIRLSYVMLYVVKLCWSMLVELSPSTIQPYFLVSAIIRTEPIASKCVFNSSSTMAPDSSILAVTVQELVHLMEWRGSNAIVNVLSQRNVCKCNDTCLFSSSN